MSLFWPLLLIAGCTFDGEVGENPQGVDDDGDGYAEEDGDCNDRDPELHPAAPELCDGLDNDCDGTLDGEVCDREEGFRVTPVLDLLLVVDDTESMREERDKLAAGIGELVPHVIDPAHDVHLGLISSNLDDPLGAGALHESEGLRWLEGTDSEELATRWLQAVVDLPSGGAALEQHRAATFAALEDEAGGWNAGFRRPEAHLALVVLSDEDDGSPAPTLDQFVDWLASDPGLDRSAVHAIVSIEPDDPCGSGAEGLEHLDLVALTGGTFLSVCATDYGPFLSGLGQAAIHQALPREFPLAEPAIPESVGVTLGLPGGFIDALGADRFVYDESGQRVILLDDLPPEAGSQVTVFYRAEPG